MFFVIQNLLELEDLKYINNCIYIYITYDDAWRSTAGLFSALCLQVVALDGESCHVKSDPLGRSVLCLYCSVV